MKHSSITPKDIEDVIKVLSEHTFEDEEDTSEGEVGTTYESFPYPESILRGKELEEAGYEAREKLIETESDYDTFSSPELLDEVTPDEDATMGIIDKLKGKKKMKSKQMLVLLHCLLNGLRNI